MINRIATNTTGNYCLSKSHTCHITSSLLQHVLNMSSSSKTQAVNVDTIRQQPGLAFNLGKTGFV